MLSIKQVLQHGFHLPRLLCACARYLAIPFESLVGKGPNVPIESLIEGFDFYQGEMSCILRDTVDSTFVVFMQVLKVATIDA
jgi:hypothetical protein